MPTFTNKSLIYVCLSSIRVERAFFTVVATDFKIIFTSRFNNKICLQLAIYILPFKKSNNFFWFACDYVAQRSFGYFDSSNKFINLKGDVVISIISGLSQTYQFFKIKVMFKNKIKEFKTEVKYLFHFFCFLLIVIRLAVDITIPCIVAKLLRK